MPKHLSKKNVKERKHNYLVGYAGEGQYAYDMKRDEYNRHWVDPLTLYQAKRALKELVTPDSKYSKKCIFKLVPISLPTKKQKHGK